MVLYGITLVPLVEELREMDPTLLSPFYDDDAAFNGLELWSAEQFRLMMYQGTDRVYLPDTDKFFLIADNPEEKEAKRREFEQAFLNLNYIYGGRYLGAYLGPWEKLEDWVRPKMEA